MTTYDATATCRNLRCTVVTYAYDQEGRDTVPECPACDLRAIVTEAALETYKPDGSERFVAEFHRVLRDLAAARRERDDLATQNARLLTRLREERAR